MSPEHHLIPILFPTSWRRGRRNRGAALIQDFHGRNWTPGMLSLVLLLALTACGCAGKAKKQAEYRRAYSAGVQAAQAQMQQAQRPQSMSQPLPSTTDPQVRILGSVRNPVLTWSEGLTLARALVLADYEKSTAPTIITIYRNNQPLEIDPQRVLQGEDCALFPGDIVYIQD
jgi:hypothetical protein